MLTSSVMNIVNSTTLRNNLSDTIKEVSENRDYLLVSKRGKINSALVNIDLFEDLLALADKDYLETIRVAREEYKENKLFSHGEVFGEI